MRFNRWHVIVATASIVLVVATAIHDTPSAECSAWLEHHKRVLWLEAVDGGDVAEPPRPKGCDR